MEQEVNERLRMMALGFSVAIALNLLKVKAANAVDTVPKPPNNPGGVQP